jgi:hypothetical protein
MATDERRTVEEGFESACNASSLKVGRWEEPVGKPIDYVIAAGWNESRLGMALLRMASEFDGAAKPHKLTAPQVVALAEANRDKDGKPRHSWAKSEALLWYRRELMLLAQSLKSRASVLEQLTQWAILRGIDPLIVGPALYWWLSSTCPVCDGHGVRKAEGAARLSAKRCNHCHGTGKVPHPEGSARVLAHIDYAVSVARGSLKKRLRNMR